MAKDQRGMAIDSPLRRHVVLVGLMGAGKSPIGRRLATRLGARFLDADREIEIAAGMTIPEIFTVHGEPAFREGERRVISRIIEGPPLVLATGGGAFIDDETRALLKERAFTVWMRAELEVLMRRVSKRGGRPLLKSNPRKVLTDLIEQRHPIYAEADIVIDSRDEPHEIAVDAIAKAVREAGMLTETCA